MAEKFMTTDAELVEFLESRGYKWNYWRNCDGVETFGFRDTPSLRREIAHYSPEPRRRALGDQSEPEVKTMEQLLEALTR